MHTWPEVELLENLAEDLLVGDLASAIAVHVDRKRLGNSNGV